jgi:glycosyltransferase involved in cell wall biosynthesis
VTYLLQEDERAFYPHGDKHLRCAETMEHGAARVVLNSELLREHFRQSGLSSLAERALVFEPAFPSELYHLDRSREKLLGGGGDRLNFLFYARPRHARNLYLRGLEALATALEDGRIDPQRWTFHFVGGAGQLVTLPRGADVRHVPTLAWKDYAALMRRMDAGLCLMYTPHPSYPPLDLAACGAAVVTNAFGVKQTLSRYSDSILCSGTSPADLAHAIGKAASMAADWRQREAAYGAARIQRDWRAALEPVLEALEGPAARGLD